ncbi:MAG: hypothetical protein KC466_18490, partial [Myxococcales bacterium]|nr:hypothetical protein [Myxococcales bacterium]
ALKDPGDSAPPWRVTLTAAPFIGETAISTFSDVTVTRDNGFPGGNALDLQWIVNPDLTLTARLELAAGSRDLVITAGLTNDGSLYGAELAYPILDGIGDLSQPGIDSWLLGSNMAGLLYRNPFTTLDPVTNPGIPVGTYPIYGAATLQMVAYYADGIGGFSLSTRDPHDTVKEFAFYAADPGPGLAARVGHRSWDLAPGSDLVLDYPILITALTEGTWQEPANIYREWATSTGPEAPPWTARGRLEDRVALGDFSQWLAEDVGFAVLGLPSGADASAWINAFNAVSPSAVLYLLAHDWPAWAGADPQRYQTMDTLAQAVGLPAFREVSPVAQWLCLGTLPPDLQEIPEAVDHCVTILAAILGLPLQVTPANRPDWKALFDLIREDGPWLSSILPPFTFEPAQFHPANLAAIIGGGSYFAPFEFDQLYYGEDLDAHGLVTDVLRSALIVELNFNNSFVAISLDPASAYWRDVHRARDVSLVGTHGARALYYDISPNNPGAFYSDRTDRGRPVGSGRAILDDYAAYYDHIRAGAAAAAGQYVPIGIEATAEVMVGLADYSQLRIGGHVQGDIEGELLADQFASGDLWDVPLFTYVYHEYGPIGMNGWVQLGEDFGEIFYWLAAKTLLRGEILEVQYDMSSTDLFPGQTGPGLQMVWSGALYEDPASPAVDLAKRDFLGDVADVRTGFGAPYLAYGRMRRPATVTSAVPNISLDWYHRNGGFIVNRETSGSLDVP